MRGHLDLDAQEWAIVIAAAASAVVAVIGAVGLVMAAYWAHKERLCNKNGGGVIND